VWWGYGEPLKLDAISNFFSDIPALRAMEGERQRERDRSTKKIQS
jgi:hypothetical protein